MKYKIKYIKYFSPDGKDALPDAVYFHKGGFVHECKLNAGKFKIPTTGYLVKNGVIRLIEEPALFMFNGAISVLPNNAKLDEEMIISWLTSEITNLNTEHEIGFSVGKFFYRLFGKVFDENSVCFQINGIKWKLIIQLNKSFLNEFKIQKVLIKDIQTGKIFLMTKEQ